MAGEKLTKYLVKVRHPGGGIGTYHLKLGNRTDAVKVFNKKEKVISVEELKEGRKWHRI